ncbi:MAG: GNAT family N-acetyltransferase [Dehalococcoidia bacterium]|nr:GNAT family N-acetyltransferase [Dehalococcoidia bacterium]
MREEVTLRLCMPKDIESVLEVWRLAGSTPSITDTVEDLISVINSNAALLLVAESEGSVAASVIAAFDGWRGNIYRLAVHPDHQRKGIARRLVLEAEEWLRGEGAKRVGAVVEKDHPWAIGFWQSAGFVLEPMDLRYVKSL